MFDLKTHAFHRGQLRFGKVEDESTGKREVSMWEWRVVRSCAGSPGEII